MLKKYGLHQTKLFYLLGLCLLNTVCAEPISITHKNYAAVTPARVTPPIVTPSTVTPANVTPPVITPPTITPMTINPAFTRPPNTTPSITTPPTITPAQVRPGTTSSVTSTTINMPNQEISEPKLQKSKLLTPLGIILKTSGAVNSIKATKKIHPLKEKSLVFVNDIIYTKPGGKVALRFNDGTFVVLGPDSALEIKEYQFTPPAKGENYFGAPRDRAKLKLYKGNLKAKLGSLASENKAGAFVILTPRGRLVLLDPKKDPNIELIYNNMVGLAVKAVGILSNSKGQVSIKDNQHFGSVSAVIGSAPILVSTLPFAFTEDEFVSTGLFFTSLMTNINTVYDQNMLTEEEKLLSTESSSQDSDASAGEIPNFDTTKGEDDGDVEDEEDDDDELLEGE